MTFTLPAHSSRAFLIKKVLQDGGFVYNDGNFYLGLGEKNGRNYYYHADRYEITVE